MKTEMVDLRKNLHDYLKSIPRIRGDEFGWYKYKTPSSRNDLKDENILNIHLDLALMNIGLSMAEVDRADRIDGLTKYTLELLKVIEQYKELYEKMASSLKERNIKPSEAGVIVGLPDGRKGISVTYITHIP